MAIRGITRSAYTRAALRSVEFRCHSPYAIHTFGPPAANLDEVVDHLGATGNTGIVGGTEICLRRPAVGHKDRGRFIVGKNRQHAVTATVLTDKGGRLLVCNPTGPGNCPVITHVRVRTLGEKGGGQR